MLSFLTVESLTRESQVDEADGSSGSNLPLTAERQQHLYKRRAKRGASRERERGKERKGRREVCLLMKEMTEVRMLKEGKYVLLDDEPCTIVSIATSKPGKHGAAKARIEGIGVFDGQKRSAILPVTAKIYVPIIERRTGQVISVMGDTAQVMDLQTYETIEMKIPEELRERGLIEPGREVPFLHYEGRYKIDLRA